MRRREKKERKGEKGVKKREKEREREKNMSIIINLYSILKKKNQIYRQKCSKSQKVAVDISSTLSL